MRTLLSIILIITVSSCNYKSAKTYFNEATKLEEQNKLPEAIKLLDKSIEKDSNYLPAYINRAVDKAMLGYYKEAIQDYDIVLRKDSKNTLAFLNRGKNKHRLLNYRGAIDDFQKAINSKGGEGVRIEYIPNNSDGKEYDCSMEEIKLERGVSFYFTGDLNKSFNDIEYCIKNNFERKIALYWRGMIYISSDKKDLGCKDLQESSRLENKDAVQEIDRFCN
jgi:tetratricopeptide (TPR) repeat protein